MTSGCATRYSRTIRSTSSRCGFENSSAEDAPGAAKVRTTALAAARMRNFDVMVLGPCGLSGAGGGIRRLDVDDIVGTYPGGRADRKTRLGTRGELARGFDVAAREGGLRGSEVGIGKVALAAIGHCQLRKCFR